MSDIPPTIPGDIDLPPEGPKWPKTVGIISIAWGGLGLLCGVCGGAGIAMQTAMGPQIEQQMGGPMPDVLRPTLVQYGSLGLGVVLSVVLVVAGILLLNRSRASVALHMAYAVSSLLVTVVATAAGVMRILEQASWAKANPADKWAQNVNLPIALGAAGFGFVLGVAWPMFCLVWFGVKKKRPTEGQDEGREGVWVRVS